MTRVMTGKTYKTCGDMMKAKAKAFGVGGKEQYTPALPISPRSAGVSGGGWYK